MKSPFEIFAREYDDTALAVYDHRLQFIESNRAFDELFHSCRNYPLNELLAQMSEGEDYLSQMMMYVEMERGVGACSVAYSSDGNRWELKTKLVAIEEGDSKKYVCSFTDTTELHFAQKVLMHRSDSMEKLDRNSPVGVFKAAVAGNVLFVNSGLVSMLGYENEHQIYNLELSLVWVSVSDRKNLLKVLQKEKAISGFECRWRHKSGSIFWVSLTATGQMDNKGNLVYFEVVVIDVDEKKSAEEDLRRLQNRQQNLIDSKTAELKRANDLLLKEVAVRQRAESIYAVLHSIAEETVSSESLKHLLEFIHHQLSSLIHAPNLYFAFYNKLTDDYTFPYSVDIQDHIDLFSRQESMKGSLTEYVRLTEKPLLIDHEAFIKMVDEGRVACVGSPSEQWMGIPLRGPEGVWGVLATQSYTLTSAFSKTDLALLSGLGESVSMAISRYRSEQNRKRMEALYNTVVENLQQGVAMCDPADRILFVNDAFSRIVDILPESLYGKDINNFLPLKDRGRMAGMKEINSRGKSSSYHMNLIRSDEKCVPVSVRGIPRFEDGDSFIGTIALFDLIEEAELLAE